MDGDGSGTGVKKYVMFPVKDADSDNAEKQFTSDDEIQKWAKQIVK